jgi:hypothetical protein
MHPGVELMTLTQAGRNPRLQEQNLEKGHFNKPNETFKYDMNMIIFLNERTL